MPSAEVPEHVDTMSLIFPLRYDVMVRKGFFDLYAKMKQQNADHDSVVAAARADSYYQWFLHIMVPRNAPQLLGDDDAISSLFERRVHDNIALFDSLQADGFDERHPITPYAGLRVRFSPGRASTGQFHAGDGCHRIAALLTLGYNEIPKRFLKPKLFNKLTPLDNTRRIASVVDVPEAWLATRD